MSATDPDPEDEALRSVALRNLNAILLARQRAEDELTRAREALEARTTELSHSLSMMQATLESTADGILVTGAQHRVVTFNENFLKIWGLERDAVEGAAHEDLVRLVGRRFLHHDRLATRIAEIYADPSVEALDLLELDDGRVLERFSRPQTLASTIIGRVWSYRDVSARKRAEESVREEARALERLVESERGARADIARVSGLKDEFLATLSHELRTPLSAILGWARVLLHKRGDPATLDRGLEAIERNAVAQARLVDDLLDMSGIISGKIRLEVQPTDLSTVIEAAIEAVRPSAEAKQIRLQQNVDPLAGPISGDPNRLQQVVWNLLSNAIKFTPRGGSAEVALQRVDSHLELGVSDSGAGIAADFLPHVFDRFRQADASTTRRAGGLGLGLSIVKQLVELHGGSVRASSAGLGQGASFVVSLPLAAVRVRADQERPALFAPVSLQGLKIVVVDDEPDARELISRLLHECQAEVHTAASASEALQVVERVHPDLLISDIGLPERDGYQLIRDIRRLAPERGGRLPAIALTAFARSEDRIRAMLAGYQVHMAKPIEPHELVATVASLSGRMETGAG